MNAAQRIGRPAPNRFLLTQQGSDARHCRGRPDSPESFKPGLQNPEVIALACSPRESLGGRAVSLFAKYIDDSSRLARIVHPQRAIKFVAKPLDINIEEPSVA